MTTKKPKVKCPGCDQRFHREDHEHIHLKNRYWHKSCYNNQSQEQQQEQDDKLMLEAYICGLFKTDYISPRIRKQINDMINQYGFTLSGILGSLKYWFEVKDGCISKANGGIGIVPYIYSDAAEYFQRMDAAHQVNKGIESVHYEVVEVVIPSPKRNVKQPKVVSLDFLEERGN